MFYNLHKDAIIGYKKLSQADLGTNPKGNQTHIGLYADTLQFIRNFYQEASAQVIYKNRIYESVSLINPIHTPSGSLRSPKMRIGNQQELETIGLNSTANIIRNIANKDTYKNWFMLWFGLENEELVFLIFEENSSEYTLLFNELGDLTKGYIKPNTISFSRVVSFIAQKVNYLNSSYLEELELLSQGSNAISTRKKPRRYDIEKAQQLFQKMGRDGEELVNNYLEKEKFYNNIQNFNWVNKNSESGLPFDFEIINNNGKLIYSDAKSTSYKFEQKIFFSSQELQFIYQNSNYLIHRVFNLREEPKLKICNNIESVSHNFIKELNIFSQKINQNGLLFNSMKISINPALASLRFNNEVEL
jgi:hypothetical protein